MCSSRPVDNALRRGLLTVNVPVLFGVSAGSSLLAISLISPFRPAKGVLEEVDGQKQVTK